MQPNSKNPESEYLYIETALPLPLRRNFTYRLEADKAEGIIPGTRLIVPFGKRTLTGYAVATHKDLSHEPGLDQNAIKDVIEVVDDLPLITSEIFDLAEWASDYYATSFGEMLKASLPAGINTGIELQYQITSNGIDKTDSMRSGAKKDLLALIAENPDITTKEIAKKVKHNSLKRILNELIKDGLIITQQRTETSNVKAKRRKAVRLLSPLPEDDGKKPLTETQNAVLDTLRDAGGQMLFAELLTASGSGASPITTLARRGYLEITEQEVRRDPLADMPDAVRFDIELNDDQTDVLSNILEALRSDEYNGFLLHGVTGSGKTEVYIRAMKEALSEGRSSLMLVPEIALTPIFSQRLKAVFGKDVAILHSNLSPGERFDEWRRISKGEARIAIGTRSAIFAPLENIGLLIIDEEHDVSYRQHESPFYNARDLAVVRANRSSAVIVLGSATPSLETFHNAKVGKYKYLRLANRIGGRPLAKAELIDMRAVFKKAGKDVVFSPLMLDAIRETHLRGEQSIILLNRRGFSAFVLCRSCGESLRCKNCDISMTYHKNDKRLICHYCCHNVQTPSECPFCKSEFLYFMGQGTEKLEEQLAKIFPEMKIVRVDRDTMSRKGEMSKTLFSFDRGEIDMLVGTQMLAKGHDFHNVTLVGVVSVDTGLGLPDFRAAERTFQLLTQVAGRAGRGQLAGTVLIQTYYPDHYALRFAAGQDYEGFYNEEIRFREALSYPPFVVVASLMIKHKDRNYAMRTGEILRRSLDNFNSSRKCRILGPAQASIGRIKNEYRIQIILKTDSRKALRSLIDSALEQAETLGSDRRIIQVEIDPIDLM